MATNTFDDVLQEQRAIRRDKDNIFRYKISGGLLAVAILLWVGLHLFAGGDEGFSYKTNAYTEALSIVVTVLVLNTLAEMREVRQLKEQLIQSAGSTSNEIAKDAVHQLRKRKWLTGEAGLLQDQDLNFADLHNIITTTGANLRGAYLMWAKLADAQMPLSDFRDTNLGWANLDKANLGDSDFSGADLFRASFQGANLWSAKLMGAMLGAADFRGANLKGADLNNAQLWALHAVSHPQKNDAKARVEFTRFDENTILPDGSNWTPDTRMEEFGVNITPTNDLGDGRRGMHIYVSQFIPRTE